MSRPQQPHRWVLAPARTGDESTELILAPLFARQAWNWRWWWYAVGFCLLLVVMMAVSISWLLAHGIGVWGNNTTVVWGFAIANYVWWVGVANAGTAISGLLLITRQDWRAGINRLAQIMGLVAAGIAGVFPIFHLGRPLFFYWLMPYPNVMALWPQWRSALVWDFWCIATYILFAILFLYVELMPDFATLRDRSKGPVARVLYGIAALGWRGSARHWHYYRVYHRTLAALAVPILVGVHSVVALDFAASLMPMWSDTIFPPYFVVEALLSGFGMLAVVGAAVRWGFGLEALITRAHFDMLAKWMLACSVLMALFFLTEYFAAFYLGQPTERRVIAYAFTGDYRVFYWGMLFCECAFAHVFWSSRLRRNIPLAVAVGIAVNVGVWLDQMTIIWNTLGRSYAISMWRLFYPTFWDSSLTIGTLALFALALLLIARIVPLVSIHEMRQLLARESQP